MTEDNAIARPSSGHYQQAGAAIQRAGFGSTEIERRGEQQATALAARAQAEIQARYIVAMQRPRDLDTVRVKLLAHCRRKGFAARAEYAKPVGGTSVRGPSIRFVETAIQEYGNIYPESVIIVDDDERRVERVSVTDLERNVTYSADVTVEKWVESLSPRPGDDVLGARQNSQGRTTYKVRDTGDRFENKLLAAVSKRLRSLGLRVLPTDLVEEGMAVCKETRLAASAEDPDADRKRVADVFAGIGVTALADFLGHSIASASPAELEELRAVYAAIRDGEASWHDAVTLKRGERGEIEEAKPSAAQSKIRDRMAARAARKQTPTEPLPQSMVPPPPSEPER